MKIWKLAAITMLALVPAAFAAPTLQLTTSAADAVPQLTEVQVTPGVPITLNVNLLMSPSDTPVTQVSFAVMTDKPGLISMTGREILSPILSDGTTSTALLTNAANGLLNPKNARDAGLTSFDGATGVQGNATLQTLTFTLDPSVQLPAHLTIVGAGGFVNGTWGDADFNSFDLPQTSVTLVPVPEPASMLLVAAGAAFFARRRRA